MKIRIAELLEGASSARGTAVIIDVFRAFSLECYLYARGARQIFAAGTPETAFSLKELYPEALLIGEKNGVPLPGFDGNNSPAQFKGRNLSGMTIIHTTSAGTRGIAAARNADEVLTGSLVNSLAIAQYLLAREAAAAASSPGEGRFSAGLSSAGLSSAGFSSAGFSSIGLPSADLSQGDGPGPGSCGGPGAGGRPDPFQVTLVAMGLRAKKSTEEDVLCARYIESLIKGQPLGRPEMEKEIEAMKTGSGARFFDPANQGLMPEEDFHMCVKTDLFPFVLRAERTEREDCYSMVKIPV